MKKRKGLTPEQLERAKCEDSPTGAHHWVIGQDGSGYCKYCGESREFVLGWVDAGYHAYRRPEEERDD